MNREKIIYLYRPEKEGEYGEILYSFIDDVATTIKKAEKDMYGKYGYMAEKKVKECVDKKNLPMQCIQAWY